MDIFLEVLDKLSSWLSLLPRISAKNIVEIAIISFLVYELLVWIKNTRAWTLLKGLLVILPFQWLWCCLSSIPFSGSSNITAICGNGSFSCISAGTQKGFGAAGKPEYYYQFLPVDSSGKKEADLMSVRSMSWSAPPLKWQR